MAQKSLPPNVVSSAQVRPNVVNLLNIRDTELSSFLGVEEKRTKVHEESNVLFDYTRKAIQRLTYLNKVLAQLEVPCESQMENWKTNLQVMAAKEEQQYNKYEMLLNRVGYRTKISHRELLEMAEQRKELEKMAKPVVDTLRSYQDLPQDKALAALAIEDKKRQFAAAEKYIEEVLQCVPFRVETSDE